MGGSRSLGENIIGKSSQNSPMLVVIFWHSCYVWFVGINTLLKVIKEFHGLLSVWHLESGVCEHTFKHKHAISAIALSTKLCISGCDSGIVTVWDVKSGQVVKVGNELNQDGSPPSLLSLYSPFLCHYSLLMCLLIYLGILINIPDVYI